MSGQVTGPGQAASIFSASTKSAESASAPAAIGQWKGLAVSPTGNPMSLVSEAAEEMKHSLEQFFDRELAARRRQQNHNNRHYQVTLPRPSVLAQIQQRLAERLKPFLAAIRGKELKPSEFRKLAKDKFPDATERHALMVWFEEEFKEKSPAWALLAENEREEIEAEAGQEVQAGYNIADVDADAIGGPDEGRNAYRRVIIGCRDIAGMLEELITRHGEADLAETVAFLRKAVGADLSAVTPSTDKHELETMNNDLYQLRTLGNFMREFDGDLNSLRESKGKKTLPFAAVNTLRLFCKAKNERLIMLDPLKITLGLEGKADPTYDVRALTLACGLAHELPNKIFTDEDSRQLLLAAGQKMLDAAIDLEEDMLEG